MTLEGKVALVTGATTGIGWAVCQRFAAEGTIVLLNGRPDDGLLADRAAELASEFGVVTAALPADARDPVAIAGCYRQILKDWQRLDVLVANAGVLGDAVVGMITQELLTTTLETNVFGTVHHLQGAARLMMRARRGSIVAISSIVGTNGNPGQVAYAASKAAVIGAVLSAAKELGPTGIRVNAIAPGFIDTRMVEHLTPEITAQRVASIPLGRSGTPEEVADAVLFLASDHAAYITGHVLAVDGGMII